MIKYFITFIFLFFTAASFAQERAFSIADIGSSAKYIGLGGVELSTNSAASVFHNPALITAHHTYSVSMFTTQLFDEVTYRNLAVSYKLNKFNFALGMMDVRVSDIPETTKVVTNSDYYFDINGYYDLHFFMYKAAVNYRFNPRFSLAMGLSYIDNSISSISATGFNLDVGTFYKLNTHYMSFSIDNILQNYDLEYSNNGTESYPLKTTFAYRKNWPFLSFLIQSSFVQDNLPQYGTGIELKHPSFSFLDAFVGYKSDYYLDEQDYKLTLGFGLNFFGVSFHYAYQKSDYFQEDNYSFFSMDLNI